MTCPERFLGRPEMAASNRCWFILAALLVVAVFGPLALWGIWAYLWAGPAAISQDAPTPLASVLIPHRASSLAWSADGAYLAVGAWGWNQPKPEDPVKGEVVVVDIAKAAIATTLKTKGTISALACLRTGSGWPWPASTRLRLTARRRQSWSYLTSRHSP